MPDMITLKIGNKTYDIRDSRIGDLADLDTTAKNSLVSAINEVFAGCAPTDQQVQEAVDAWLEENISQETGYALDRALTLANAAAPADLVGDLKSAVFNTGTETFVNNKDGPYSTNIPTNYLRLYKTPVPAGYTIESIDIYIGTPPNAEKPLFDLTLWKLNDGTLTLDKTFHCDFERTLCDTIQNVVINYDTTAKTYIGIHTIHGNSAFANQDGTGSYYTTDLESTSFQIGNLSSSSWGTCMTVNTSYDINTIDSISEEVKTLKNNIITVGTTGDYSTIQEACNAATNGSTILVYPGTYREHIIAHGKTLHLVGIDKDACIIIDSTGNYNTPPVNMNLGSIRNFTIIEDALDPTGEDVSGQVPVTNMAYCIHADNATNITSGSELVIDNCNMINANRPCVGAGLYSNYTIKITNCNMYSGVGVQTGYHRGVLYFHNNQQDNVSGQKMIIDNCKCVCADEKALYSLATSAANVGLSVEMTRNIFYSEINGTDGIIEGNLAVNYLSGISSGNNLSELNAN